MKCNTTRHRQNESKFSRMRKVVHTFFERDDNSRMTTGLKQTITKQKDKRQKRFMLDILRNLYMKYESENNERISFTTFWRLKPFCKTSENLSFMVKVLFRHQVISTPNTNILVQQVVCSTQRMNCMYGSCGKCQEKQIETKPFDHNLPVVYSQWISEKEMEKPKKSLSPKEKRRRSVYGSTCQSSQ